MPHIHHYFNIKFRRRLAPEAADMNQTQSKSLFRLDNRIHRIRSYHEIRRRLSFVLSRSPRSL